MIGLAFGALAVAPSAHAWGDEGHRILALVAEHYLSARTQVRVQALLAQDHSGLTQDSGMASEATWADRYRDSDREGARLRYEQTWRWHFINMELFAPDLEAACYGEPQLPAGVPASAGPAEDCVVNKVNEFERELSSSRTAPAERLMALQFLLHLVGDLHQPLHAADNQDAGGNRVRVAERGVRAGSLHHYWDTVFVESLGEDASEVADGLCAHIGARELAAWQRGSPADWAGESFALARRVAYGELPDPRARRSGRRRSYELSEGYARDASALVALQLSRAGVRLAWLLNRALDPGSGAR
jgi:hypothetical protein